MDYLDFLEEATLALCPSNMFLAAHNQDVPGAKYRIGDVVSYNGTTGTITGVNSCEGTYEYSIAEEEFIFWESELLL